MKRIAVFVATTAGPVRVERITRERAPQSMVCLNRTSTVLPISAAYDSFVRPGSGVIERSFGPFEPGAFRLDVAAPIESGESWQLGFFIAHALCPTPEGGTLATAEQADAIIWLTGHVDCDLAVGPVGHLPEKIHASREAFADWRAVGRPVSVFVPAGADHDAVYGAGVPAGVDIIAVHTAEEVLAALGVAMGGPPVARGNTLPAHPATVRRAPARLLAGGLVLSVAAAVALSQWPGTPVPAPSEHLEAVATAQPAALPVAEQPASAPVPVVTPPVQAAPSAVRVLIVERRAPAGRSCAEVQFGTVAATEAPVATSGAEPGTSMLQGLCGLGVAVDNGEAPRFAAVNVEAVAGKLLYGTVRPEAFNGQTAFTGRHEWAIDLPRRLKGPFEIRVTATTGAHPVAETADADSGEVANLVLRHRVIP